MVRTPPLVSRIWKCALHARCDGAKRDGLISAVLPKDTPWIGRYLCCSRKALYEDSSMPAVIFAFFGAHGPSNFEFRASPWPFPEFGPFGTGQTPRPPGSS